MAKAPLKAKIARKAAQFGAELVGFAPVARWAEFDEVGPDNVVSSGIGVMDPNSATIWLPAISGSAITSITATFTLFAA